MNSRPSIHYVGTTGHSLVLNEAMSLLALLNPSATYIWGAYTSGQSPRDIARLLTDVSGRPYQDALSEVDNLVSQWQASRLFDISTPDTSLAIDLFSFPKEPASQESFLQLNRRRIRIRSWLSDAESEDILARLMHRVIDPCSTDDEIEIHPAAQGMSFWSKGKMLSRALTSTEGAAHLYEILLNAECGECAILTYLHAACVSWQGKSIVLCGVSGAGKSTLTAALCRQGAHYLGDELSAVLSADWSLRALPTSLSFKCTGHHIAEEILHISAPSTAAPLWNVDPHTFATLASEAQSPTLLLFPQYRRNTQLKVRRLNEVEAVESLFIAGATFGISRKSPDVSNFLNWVSSTAAFELIHSNIDEAITAIREVLHA